MARTKTPPPSSQPSTKSSRSSSRSKLSLDLSNVPPLVQPTPPTNTLLITELDDPAIFEPANLITIRETINQHVPVHIWAPLKLFRRIIVSFFDVPSATFIKQTLDGEVIMDCRVRIFFGATTDMEQTRKLLELPKVDKLFFISPPPSPPHDWEIRNEDPPNKDVHAEDLAHALSRLHATAPDPVEFEPRTPEETELKQRMRSGSTTLVYHPDQHGSHPSLPVISVEDTSDSELSPVEEPSPMEDVKGPILHTSRPPVELMEQ
ncbi:calcineurin binding protein-like protein [Microthyrium microscopicum]|uniref:Calcineurin binding protein-like protein n=1 Tax=Microthyrium microscopicum TaxID=703497 RepID=A0A6A6TY39_9PEZI|nr:calcineurin binding protein-like protein [Microthyrium microscopicum]